MRHLFANPNAMHGFAQAAMFFSFALFVITHGTRTYPSNAPILLGHPAKVTCRLVCIALMAAALTGFTYQRWWGF
jgi:hypothetical protein